MLLPLGGEGNRKLEERMAVRVVRSEGREMIRCGVSKIIRLALSDGSALGPSVR